MLIVIKTLGITRPGPGGGREDDLRHRHRWAFSDSDKRFVLTGRPSAHAQLDVGFPLLSLQLHGC